MADQKSIVDKSGVVRTSKLTFKIKLPTSSAAADPKLEIINHHKGQTSSPEEEEDQSVKYMCSLCSKGFRSRKALGGHMRVHAHNHHHQQRRTDYSNDLNDVALELKQTDQDNDEIKDEESVLAAAAGGICSCPICDKDFPSNKALFGHMRCHPERSWRGIQPPHPPPPPVYSSSSTVEDDDDVINDSTIDDNVDQLKQQQGVDLLGFGWGAKDIRGRDGTVPHQSYSSSSCCYQEAAAEMEPEQADGVQSLMLLAQGAGVVTDHSAGLLLEEITMTKKKKRKNSEQEEEVNKKLKVSETATTELEENVRQLKGSENALVLPDGYRAAEELFMQQTEANKKQMHKFRKYLMVNDHLNHANLPPPAPHSSPVKRKLMTYLHQNLQVGSNSNNMDRVVVTGHRSNERYKCTICNKCFSSHQALGGHKSSHNKLRNIVNVPASRPDNDIIQQVRAQAQAQSVEAGPGYDDHHMIQPLHQCNVCFKIYPSGQALGGHKRLHCSSSLAVSKNPPQCGFVTAESEAAVAPTLTLAAPSIVAIVPAEPEVTPPPAAPTSAQAVFADKGVFTFDLNEIPPLEEENMTIAAEQPPQEADTVPSISPCSASA